MRPMMATCGLLLIVSLLNFSAAFLRGQPPAAAGGVTPWVTRQMAFNIPFSVPAEGVPPAAVELYVSHDEGETWQLYGRQRPDARHFQFQARREGSYWFASRTVHAQQRPVDPHQLQAELAVVVDLQGPKMSFEATAGPAGDILATWEASDLTLDDTSLKIEYLPRVGQPWKSVVLDQKQTTVQEGTVVGRMTWRPDAIGNSVHVRAEIADRAGNKSVVNRLVFLPSSPAHEPVAAEPTANAGTTTLAGRPPSPQSILQDNGIIWPADNRLPSDPTIPPSGTEFVAQNPEAQRPESDSAHQPDAGRDAGFLPTPTAVRPPVGTQFVSQQDPGATAAAMRDRLPGGETPRMTRSRRFQLDYDVDSVSPSGIRKVELWGTSDGGQTWSRWREDDDRQSPIDVEVSSDGVFGFRIVIVSNNGLAGAAPRNGDTADLWVGVDSTRPELRLTSAIYGDGDQVGQLDIRWHAEDVWLGEKPISLAFSEEASGPWTTIATGLPNSGQYYWSVDPRIPKKIYLRIEARDEAGNVTQYTVDEPVSLAGLIPSARIRGVRPL